MKTIIPWLIANREIFAMAMLIILSILFIVVWAYKIGAPKGILWIVMPKPETVTFTSVKESRIRAIRGGKKPKGFFQSIWYRIGIHWIGFFRHVVEFTWEVRSVKIENDEMVGTDDPKINKHATSLPVNFPIAGVNRFVVQNGTVRFIFNLYCVINSDEEIDFLAKIRTIPEWQEMVLTAVYSAVENLLKDKTTQEIAVEDIMGEKERFKKNLYGVNHDLSKLYHVQITHADIKFDEEANKLQAEALNKLGATKYASQERELVALTDQTIAKINRDTAAIKLEQTKIENNGIVDLQEKLKDTLEEDYKTFIMAEAIKETEANNLVLQTNAAVVPVSTPHT